MNDETIRQRLASILEECGAELTECEDLPLYNELLDFIMEIKNV